MLNTPTRKISFWTWSPFAEITCVVIFLILPCSVISLCSSNHSCSISSSEASSVEEPIFSASVVRNSPRFGNSMLVNEFWNWPRASPAACWSTPNNSFNEPIRTANCSRNTTNCASFTSNSASNPALCASWAARSRFASASTCCWFPLFLIKSCSRCLFAVFSVTFPDWTPFNRSSNDDRLVCALTFVDAIAISTIILSNSIARFII